MAILAIFMSVNLVSCSSDDEEVILDPSNDYGKISKNDFVATGGYRNLKPLRVTILASINTAFQGAYTSMGVQFTPNQPNFGSSETRGIISKSGITNGHFETELAWNDEGVLEPGTTYYYRAYVFVAGTRYTGETRSFETPDLQLSKGDFVDLGLSVKWASYNMGANSPEAMGTLLQQPYVYNNFSSGTFLPDNVDDSNWLGKSSYDVATRTMGSSYRIPTEDEWEELEYDCRWTSGECNGVKGFYVSDKIDGSATIFLPYVKKSSKHDITVYLSAPNKTISKIREIMNEVKWYYEWRNNSGNKHSVSESNNRYYDYVGRRFEIEDELGVGEVLTENTHRYCNEGLILRVFKDIDPWYADHDYYYGQDALVFESGELSETDFHYDYFNWTHPKTGKKYNFSESVVDGGGVLYVRAVSNR